MIRYLSKRIDKKYRSVVPCSRPVFPFSSDDPVIDYLQHDPIDYRADPVVMIQFHNWLHIMQLDCGKPVAGSASPSIPVPPVRPKSPSLQKSTDRIWSDNILCRKKILSLPPQTLPAEYFCQLTVPLFAQVKKAKKSPSDPVSTGPSPLLPRYSFSMAAVLDFLRLLLPYFVLL